MLCKIKQMLYIVTDVEISMNHVIALHNCLLVQTAYLIDCKYIYNQCLRSHIEVAIHNTTGCQLICEQDLQHNCEEYN